VKEVSTIVDGHAIWLEVRASGVIIRVTNAADEKDVIEKRLGGAPVKAEQIVDVIRGAIDGFKAAEAREAVNWKETFDAGKLLGVEWGTGR
jgi:hypothetical protein